MYKSPHPAGVAPSRPAGVAASRRSCPVPPAPLSLPSAGTAPAPFLPRLAAIPPVPHPHPALLAPAPVISTPAQETGFGFPPTTMDGQMRSNSQMRKPAMVIHLSLMRL
ncbi:unnamed protein product [Urochloa humidicola]